MSLLLLSRRSNRALPLVLREAASRVARLPCALPSAPPTPLARDFTFSRSWLDPTPRPGTLRVCVAMLRVPALASLVQTTLPWGADSCMISSSTSTTAACDLVTTLNITLYDCTKQVISEHRSLCHHYFLYTYYPYNLVWFYYYHHFHRKVLLGLQYHMIFFGFPFYQIKKIDYLQFTFCYKPTGWIRKISSFTRTPIFGSNFTSNNFSVFDKFLS